jgi:hypothetical protein
MLRKTLSCHGLVSLVLILAPLALADDGRAGDSLQGEGYHLALGQTYNMQARDHAHLLGKYAALGQRVPAEVVKEHAAAIRFNANAAKKSFAKLGETANDKPALAGQIAQMQQRLEKVTKLADRLEAQAEQGQAADSKIIAAQSEEISRQLQANHVDARAVGGNFYNSDSDSYYFEGRGHFAD